MQDLEIFKQIPGYKAILQAVIKNQIQNLVHQLADETGEESVLITASIEEGTLSQLGSEYGKVFLQGHEEIKSQFLGFCLKRKQLQKQTKEFQDCQPRKSWTSRRPKDAISVKSGRSQPYPICITKVNPGSASSSIPIGTFHTSHSTNNHQVEPPIPVHSGKNHSTVSNFFADTSTIFSHTKSTVSTVSSTSVPFSSASDAVCSSVGQEDLRVEESAYGGQCLTESVVLLTSGENHQESSETKENDRVLYYGSESKETVTDELVGELAEDAENASLSSADDKILKQVKDEGRLKGPRGCATGAVRLGKVDTGTSGKGEKKGHKSKLKLFNNSKKTEEKSLKERKAELENYLNLDVSDRPYPCNLCPKRFKERHHLVYHIRTHSGHRPYVCNVCNKRFTQSSSLNTHKKLHMKDMSCYGCGQVFRKLSLLQNHVCKCESNATLDIEIDTETVEDPAQ